MAAAMQSALERFHARVVHASRVLSWAAVGALILVCGAVLLDVALRWAFNRPLHGLEDLNALVIVLAVAACLPAGFALRANITVRAFGRLLGLRAGAWLEAFGQLVTLAFIALVAWQLAVYVGDVANRRTPILGLPVATVWRTAALFALLAALAQAAGLAVDLASAWRGRPAPRAGDGPR